jgi:hypothetical protein
MTVTKMNLLQGLRQKKRTKEQIAKLTASIQEYNSVVQGMDREIDVRKAVRLRDELKTFLVELKLKMQDTCRPIQRDILMVSELKDELAFYQKMKTHHGKFVVDYNRTCELHYDAIIRKMEVDRQCVKLQQELDALYLKIDNFNTTHVIEIKEISDERMEEIYHCN